MKLTQVTVAAVCMVLTIASCQKDQYLTGKKSPSVKSGQNDGKPDVMQDFFEANMKAGTEHFKIRADKGGRIITESGVVFTIAPNSLTNPNGGEVNGMVDVAIYVADDNSARALANFTTEAAYDPEQQNQLLTSAVSFDIAITNSEGEELSTPADGGVEVVVPSDIAGGDPDEGMTVWEGEQSADQPRDKAWEENGIPLEIVGSGYRFVLPLPCERINLDRRVTDWANAIRLRVGLPSGYTSANAEVYVFFPSSNMTASMDVYDFTTNYFGEHGGLVDPNVPLEIVAIGVDPVTSGLMYSHISITTTVNDGAGGDLRIISTMSPTTTTALDALIASF